MIARANCSMEHAIISPAAESRAARILREVFESGRPLTYVRTSEEQRAGRVLREVGLRLFAPTVLPVWTWSQTEGMHRDGETAEPGTHEARGALEFIEAYPDAAIFHLRDFHEPSLSRRSKARAPG